MCRFVLHCISILLVNGCAALGDKGQDQGKMDEDVCPKNQLQEPTFTMKSEQVRHMVEHTGYVVVSVEDINQLTDDFYEVFGNAMNYNGGTNNREGIKYTNLLTVGKEPDFILNLPHQEMCYLDTFNEYIAFIGIEHCEDGGETILVDMRALTKQMRALFPKLWEKFKNQDVKYHRKLTIDKDDPLFFSSWKEQFRVQTKLEMISKCNSSGYVCRFQGDDLYLTFTAPSLINHENFGEILFNQAYAMSQIWDTWPPYDDLPARERPYHASWADDTEFSASEIAILEKLHTENSTKFTLKKGSAIFINNILFAHGRTPYNKSQCAPKLGVILAKDRKREGKSSN